VGRQHVRTRVAATLARMVNEGKLSSRVESEKVLIFSKTDLHLTLEVDRSALAPHELALIDGLFDPGQRHTSTSQVRERYRGAGFDPASTIRDRLQAMVSNVAPGGTKPSWKLTALLLLAGLGTTIFGVVRDVAAAPTAVASIGVAIPIYLAAIVCAWVVQKSLGRLYVALATLMLPLIAGVLLFRAQLVHTPVDTLGPITLAGITLWIVGLLNSVFNSAASRQSPERIAMRKRLYAARRLFADELRNERPALLDAWFPYVIAFGLGRAADRWFRAFGGESDGIARSAIATGAASGGSSGSRGGSGWSGFGGGGGFAGGGSSASFAAAVGGMAASVPSPSSSGGGGGSSSSGGSSGGGGGGGW
jgi:uncharacterized membrane protein YgcG